jgi:sialic acid synthase SpsE
MKEGNYPMSRSKAVKVGRKYVGPGNPVYVIAEIGSNHDQNLQLALDMICAAAEAGADAVKFQSIRFDRLYNPKIESVNFREWFRQIELDEHWYPILATCARNAGVDFLSAPTYSESIDLLLACHASALKLASPQVQGNLPLVRKAAASGIPLILSMGYAEYGDIVSALRTCREENNDQLILLHCVSKYPTLAPEAKLKFISTLAAMTGLPVGYSDHTLGTHMAVAAIVLGACTIEKHVTMSRSGKGPDHHFAVTFPELREMISQIREVEAAIVDGTRLDLLDDEIMLREKVQLKAISSRKLDAGEALNTGSVVFLRSEGAGISISELRDLSLYCARRNIPADTLLQWSDLQLI